MVEKINLCIDVGETRGGMINYVIKCLIYYNVVAADFLDISDISSGHIISDI